VNFGPLAAEICLVVWGTPANFNGFCILAVLLHGTPSSGRQAKRCGVEQRAPPIFGRAAITLGIGPHSSYVYFAPLPCASEVMMKKINKQNVVVAASTS